MCALLSCAMPLAAQHGGYDVVQHGITENVMNMLWHPTSERAFMRTDVDWIYARDTPDDDWVQLETWAKPGGDYRGLTNPVGFAIDNNDPEVIYYVAGQGNSDLSGVYKSTDGGLNFTRVLDAYVAGNGTDRPADEPIIVDPNNSNVVYFGSQKDGLFRSTDAGSNWSKVYDHFVGDAFGMQIVEVAKGPTVDGPTRGQYVYFYSWGDGVYESRDGGETFNKLDFLPDTIEDMEISGDNYMFITGSFGVMRYNINTLTNDGTVLSNACLDISVAKDKSGKAVVVSTESNGSKLFRTSDHGANWTSLSQADGNMNFNLRGMLYEGTHLYNFKSPALHPNGQRFLFAGPYKIWETPDIFASTVEVRAVPDGAASKTITYFMNPPATASGNVADLYFGISDAPSMRIVDYDNISQSDKIGGASSNVYPGHSADYCGTNPDVMYIAMGAIGQGRNTPPNDAVVKKSTDGGITVGGETKPFGSTDVSGYRVAANGSNPDWAIACGHAASGANIRYTKDGGATWNEPAQPMKDVEPGDVVNSWWRSNPICADKVNENYYAVGNTGKFYKSTDGGINWSEVGSGLPTIKKWAKPIGQLEGVPGKANHIIYSAHDQVLFSTNGGSDWTALSEFEHAQFGTSGVPFNQDEDPVVYVYGNMPGDYWSLYASKDFFGDRTWQRITPDEHSFNLMTNMGASWQIPGRVYVNNGPTYVVNWAGDNTGTELNISTASITFQHPEGNQSFTISANVDWTIAVSEGAESWLDLSTSSGTDDAEVTVSVPKNDGGTRSATLTIAGGGLTRSIVVTQYDKPYYPPIYKTPTAPSIDGDAEGLWEKAPVDSLKHVNKGTVTDETDLSAAWQALWDDDNLYFFVSVRDDDKQHDDTDWHQDDGIEIYIDADHSSSTSYDENDFQFSVTWDDTTPILAEQKYGAVTGAAMQIKNTADGYMVELSLPWSLLGIAPANGHSMGLDIQVNDDDGGGAREGKRAWYATADESWKNPSLFGDIQLVSEDFVPPPLPVPSGLHAEAADSEVVLTWDRTSDSRVAGYVIYRAEASDAFAPIDTVIQTVTIYTDGAVINDQTYTYHLMAIDEDGGHSEVSIEVTAMPQVEEEDEEVVTHLLDEEPIGLTLYPNPATQQISLRMQRPFAVQIIALNGGVVLESPQWAEQHILQVSEVKTGVYIVRAYNEHMVVTRRVVVE